ncbi:hypothetical protein ACVILE_006802 [Streptomyces sp. M18.1]
MTSVLGFTRTCCGVHHPELPMNYTAEAPAVWGPACADADDCLPSTDQCVVRAQQYVVKGLIEIPVIRSDEVFSRGARGALSRESFSRVSDLWDRPSREAEKPYCGRLTTDHAVYAATTLKLRKRVHTRPVGGQPGVELEPTDHPLGIEQRTGIGPERVREIASAMLHTGNGEQR